MRIHEFQAKQLLTEYGVTVPKGRVAETPSQAAEIAAELGGPVVVKAQILAGGRGRAGGIRRCDSPQEAHRAAGAMLGKPLVTAQTAPEGVVVRRVLVEEALEAERELYLGIVVDRARSLPVMMASEAGGMEIEEVAAESPQKILREHIDPGLGFQAYQGKKLAFGLKLDASLVRPGSDMMMNLYRLFRAKDCTLAEINPLVVVSPGRLVALDAKLNFDDSALFRHPEIASLRDKEEEDPLEVEATQYDISYIRLDGSIGCMVNGAGLAMATMDMIKLAGGAPANFLDVGGGASADQVTNAFKILLSDPRVRAVLINIFGGIARCDVIAQGVVEAAGRVEIKVPLVVRLAGTNAEEGRRILAESGLSLTVATGLRDAAEKAVAATRRS